MKAILMAISRHYWRRMRREERKQSSDVLPRRIRWMSQAAARSHGLRRKAIKLKDRARWFEAKARRWERGN